MSTSHNVEDCFVDRRRFTKAIAAISAGAMIWPQAVALAEFKSVGDRLSQGKRLNPEEGLVSSKRRFCLKLESDGNLVEYFYGTSIEVWSTRTAGSKNTQAIMQDDGNFVLYRDGIAVFNTSTAGKNTTGLLLQDDGNCVIYDKDGKSVWSSGRLFAEESFEPIRVEVSQETLAIMRGNPQNLATSILLGNSATTAIAQSGAVVPVFVICTSPPVGVIVCAVALVLVLVALECMKEQPFGPNNDLRIIGGKISDLAKDSGRHIHGLFKNPAKTTDDEWKRLKNRWKF